MSEDRRTIKAWTDAGYSRATCPVCPFAGPWENANTAEGRRMIVAVTNAHLQNVHGRTPAPS